MKNIVMRLCLWQWTKSDQDEEVEDYGNDMDFEKVLDLSDGIEVDLSNPLCSKFQIFEKEERLFRPFHKTLIVKLMGKQPNYMFMVQKLNQIWVRKGHIDIFDLENEFFLVGFQSRDDYMEALAGDHR
ncbi:hypothetical protein K1719_044649 [Acacia pycnantha]|nr:hypothetical protein K1719_044649 [Acacia pycnantha]